MSRRLSNRRGSIPTGFALQAGIVLMMILSAIPVVRHTRNENHARSCQDNLAVLLAAQEKYAVFHDLKPGAKITFADLRTTGTAPLTTGTKPLLKIIPVCPDRGDYRLNGAGELPTCTHPGHALPMAGRKRSYDPSLDVTHDARERK